MEEPKATISIPYVKGPSEKIQGVCAKVRIRVCLKSSKTVCSALMKVKPRAHQDDDTKGMFYRVSCCDCDKFYISEAGRTLVVRL